jgi:hypothetical protein
MDTLHECLYSFQSVPQNTHLTPIFFFCASNAVFYMIKKNHYAMSTFTENII